MNNNKAILQLIGATVLWGFGFVATVWAIHSYTPTEALTYRFLLAYLLGILVQILWNRSIPIISKKDFISSLPAGVLLGLMQLTQAIGLRTTTATKSGFITSLYVILVPLIGALFLKKKSTPRTYFLAILALGGTYMLMGANIEDLKVGDLWTFLGAIIVAIHIIYIGKISKFVENAFRFNTYQSFWAFLTMSPLLLLQDRVTLVTSDWISITGVLCLCFGSSMVAFFLQIKAQKYLSNTTTTMLSLLESPIAAAFGFLLLGETLKASQVFGAMIILGTSVIYVLSDSPSAGLKKISDFFQT